MKALQLIQHGKPGSFTCGQWPDPTPADAEVLIRVHACGLNHLDLWTEQGELPVKIALPRIQGCEITGEVVADPQGAWQPGDRVAVQSNLFCGACEFCLKGEESLCLNSELLGVQRDGGFAELVCVPARQLVRLPDRVSFIDGAALGLAASTAMHMLTDRATVAPGQVVLVVGGTSGVGSAAIQIARALGATVIALASTEAKRALCRSLGAEHALESRSPDWPAQVRKLTQRRGVDLVVEHVGGEVLEQAFSCLARGGTVVTCGATAGRTVSMNLWPLFVKQQRLVGSYGRNRADMQNTLAWAADGRIKPVIDRVVPLEAVPVAMQALRDGNILGKVVCRVARGEVR